MMNAFPSFSLLFPLSTVGPSDPDKMRKEREIFLSLPSFSFLPLRARTTRDADMMIFFFFLPLFSFPFFLFIWLRLAISW